MRKVFRSKKERIAYGEDILIDLVCECAGINSKDIAGRLFRKRSELFGCYCCAVEIVEDEDDS